jgi:hypothetical protein
MKVVKTGNGSKEWWNESGEKERMQHIQKAEMDGKNEKKMGGWELSLPLLGHLQPFPRIPAVMWPTHLQTDTLPIPRQYHNSVLQQ